MKTSLIALALLIGASLHAEAKSPRPRSAASAPAPADRAQAPAPSVDLSYLVPKDSARKNEPDPRQSGDRIDRRGVNCAHYPARCD